MIDLQLASQISALKVKTEGGQRFVFDPIRMKWLLLQPEEFIRQLLIVKLIDGFRYNKNRIAVEQFLKVNGMPKRCDLLLFDPQMQPWMLIECKAAEVEMTQAVFDQVAMYNLPLRVPFLLVTNGRQSYACKMDYEQKSYQFLEALPAYPSNE